MILWKRAALTCVLLLGFGAALAEGQGVQRGPAGARGPQQKLLVQYLSTGGDGSGTMNAIGDYSGTADTFYVAPGASEIFRINRILIHVSDAGALQAGVYGDATADTLVVGVNIEQWDGSESSANDLDGGETIRVLDDWQRISYDVAIGAKQWDETITVRWSYVKFGQAMRLVGADGDELRVILYDDLSHLTGHYFLVQGYHENVSQ